MTSKARDTQNDQTPATEVPSLNCPPSEPKETPVEWLQKYRSNVDMSLYAHIPNPYKFPRNCLDLGLTFEGAVLQSWPIKIDPWTLAKRIKSMPVRSDDIFLLAYPKCGTHWLFAMISMLLNGSTKLSDQDKETNMLEIVGDMAGQNATSRRFLNSHRYFSLLPEEIAVKKPKIVHTIRNPKDAVVSWFYFLFHNGYADGEEPFSFDDFLKGYMLEHYCSYSHQYNYLRQMFAFARANPEVPIKHVHYEDLIENPLAVLTEIAQFLDIDREESYLREVVDVCSFASMKKFDGERKGKLGRHLYRKGVVGDWKNMFTDAQNKAFDDFIRIQEEKGGLDVKPKAA